MARKKQQDGYRHTAQDRDIRRRSWCPLTFVLLAGWPVFGVVAAVRGWL